MVSMMFVLVFKINNSIARIFVKEKIEKCYILCAQQLKKVIRISYGRLHFCAVQFILKNYSNFSFFKCHCRNIFGREIKSLTSAARSICETNTAATSTRSPRNAIDKCCGNSQQHFIPKFSDKYNDRKTKKREGIFRAPVIN